MVAGRSAQPSCTAGPALPPPKASANSPSAGHSSRPRATKRRTPETSPSCDTRVIYCGDNLDKLKKLPDGCIDLIYIANRLIAGSSFQS
jgi:hypothetical protein